MAVKWSDLTWLRKSSKFNLHHLRKISTGLKMAVLTPKPGIHRNVIILAHDKILLCAFLYMLNISHLQKMCKANYHWQ